MSDKPPVVLQVQTPGNIVQLSGHARPSAALRRSLGIMYGPGAQKKLEEALDAETAVDALARLMTEAMEKNQTKDGRIDMRDVAAHVLKEMKRNQR